MIGKWRVCKGRFCGGGQKLNCWQAEILWNTQNIFMCTPGNLFNSSLTSLKQLTTLNIIWKYSVYYLLFLNKLSCSKCWLRRISVKKNQTPCWSNSFISHLLMILDAHELYIGHFYLTIRFPVFWCYVTSNRLLEMQFCQIIKALEKEL